MAVAGSGGEFLEEVSLAEKNRKKSTEQVKASPETRRVGKRRKPLAELEKQTQRDLAGHVWRPPPRPTCKISSEFGCRQINFPKGCFPSVVFLSHLHC